MQLNQQLLCLGHALVLLNTSILYFNVLNLSTENLQELEVCDFLLKNGLNFCLNLTRGYLCVLG